MKVDFRVPSGAALIAVNPAISEVLSGEELNSIRGARFWASVLTELRIESGCTLYDDQFEKWVNSNRGITFLHENSEYPAHLTGLEMDDQTFIMLLLKYR